MIEIEVLKKIKIRSPSSSTLRDVNSKYSQTLFCIDGFFFNDTAFLRLSHYQIRQTIAQSKRLDDYTAGKPKKNSQKIFRQHNLKKTFKLSKIWFEVQNLSLKNRPKVPRGSLLVHKDQKVRLEPCRKTRHLSRKKPKKHFRLIVKIALAKNFLRNFFGFSRGPCVD